MAEGREGVEGFVIRGPVLFVRSVFPKIVFMRLEVCEIAARMQINEAPKCGGMERHTSEGDKDR